MKCPMESRRFAVLQDHIFGEKNISSGLYLFLIELLAKYTKRLRKNTSNHYWYTN